MSYDATLPITIPASLYDVAVAVDQTQTDGIYHP